MRNTVFMLNMCYSGEYYEGDLKQALARGLDEMMIVKKWKPGATTEMKWKKLIEYIALSHFPHIQREQLKLSDEEFQGQVCKILFLHNKIVKKIKVGRQRIALNPNVGAERLFEWMTDLAFRL